MPLDQFVLNLKLLVLIVRELPALFSLPSESILLSFLFPKKREQRTKISRLLSRQLNPFVWRKESEAESFMAIMKDKACILWNITTITEKQKPFLNEIWKLSWAELRITLNSYSDMKPVLDKLTQLKKKPSLPCDVIQDKGVSCLR